MTHLEREIRRTFADAGVHGRLHAAPIGGPAREVGVDPDEPVVMASVYKLPLLVAFCRRVDAGEIDPRERVTVDPAERTAGPTGLSVMRDPVTMSWRDLACSMISVSDNAAADVLLRRVGLAHVNETLSDLGLERTRVLGGTADVLDSLVADTAASDTAAAFRALTSNDAAPAVRAYDAVLASATTPREMTRLLAAVWSDRAASPRQCRLARELLGAQAWQHRLRSGFPPVGVRVAGKTGTLAAVRNEVGVVQFDGERPVAVAVFTRAARAEELVPRADAVIGQAARLAVTDLRSGRL
ncbi:class A beta-lactamase-related serine hydrolase [Pseudonocardia sp. DSM 110487]|jgi:beta-lactamase class A|uniref:serine hydrolase n=1 Tax=Pseudonocardia sp. DSM 110487 TaxID=2865833 RepID=UPI001C69E40C|nr:serine hydrolase [Pseudonocardia sp. DSM 110487]QYN32632.1 class A beta-lactamase-related serine hydrolase [Pseudonocardia sp. DSM 110487]